MSTPVKQKKSVATLQVWPGHQIYTKPAYAYLKEKGYQTYGDHSAEPNFTKDGQAYYMGSKAVPGGGIEVAVVAFMPNVSELPDDLQNQISYYLLTKENMREMAGAAEELKPKNITLFTNYGMELHSIENSRAVFFDDIVKVIKPLSSFKSGGPLLAPRDKEIKIVPYMYNGWRYPKQIVWVDMSNKSPDPSKLMIWGYGEKNDPVSDFKGFFEKAGAPVIMHYTHGKYSTHSQEVSKKIEMIRGYVYAKDEKMAAGGTVKVRIPKEERVTIILAIGFLSQFSGTNQNLVRYTQTQQCIQNLSKNPKSIGDLNLAIISLQLYEKEMTDPKKQESRKLLNRVIGQLKDMAEKYKGSLKTGGSLMNSDGLDKNLIRILAIEFSSILWHPDWIGQTNMPKVIAENKSRNDDTDATHDYVDANMAMDEAFTNIMGRNFVFFDDEILESKKQNEIDTDYVNEAWALAKDNDFDVEKIKSADTASFSAGGNVGSGENMDIYGYRTHNFNMSKPVSEAFKTAVAKIDQDNEGDEDAFSKSMQDNLKALAESFDNILHFEKIVKHQGYKFTDEDFTDLMKELHQATIFNYKSGNHINIPEIIGPHLSFLTGQKEEFPVENNTREVPAGEYDEWFPENDMFKNGGTIETDTPILPEFVADSVANEFIRNKYNNPTPLQMKKAPAEMAELSEKLVSKANNLYKSSPFFKRKINRAGNKGRDALYTFMEHWAQSFDGKKMKAGGKVSSNFKYKTGDIVYVFQHHSKPDKKNLPYSFPFEKKEYDRIPQKYVVGNDRDLNTQKWSKVEILEPWNEEKGWESYKVKQIDGYRTETEFIAAQDQMSTSNDKPIAIGYMESGGQVAADSPALIIRDQIGHKALYMLGAYNLVRDDKEKSLAFRIRGSKKVNYVKVTLAPDDTYTMEFGRIRKPDYRLNFTSAEDYMKKLYKVVDTVDRIDAEELNRTIEQHTGLYTKLFKEGGQVENYGTDGLLHAMLETVSSGTIANKTGLKKYKETDGVRHAAIQMLLRDGDQKYSMGNLEKLLDEAKYEWAEDKNYHEDGGEFAKGGQVPTQYKILGRYKVNIKGKKEEQIEIVGFERVDDQNWNLYQPLYGDINENVTRGLTIPFSAFAKIDKGATVTALTRPKEGKSEKVKITRLGPREIKIGFGAGGELGDYDQWEDDITTEIENITEVSRGDAQGMVEAQGFYMMQSWSKGLSAKDTAKLIVEKSTVE